MKKKYNLAPCLVLVQLRNDNLDISEIVLNGFKQNTLIIKDSWCSNGDQNLSRFRNEAKIHMQAIN